MLFRSAIAALLVLPRPALAGPEGGNVVSGAASITQTGPVTDINQSTQKAIINWQGFSIAPQETVNFHQPDVSSVTLNRVIGNEASVIQGALNANGQVFIVNSNGILFTSTATVNVGGLVASTLDISNEDFNAGNYVFSGSSTASVVNQGSLSATQGGYISLLGNTVSNQGVISATLGTAALGAGSKVKLNFGGNSLVDVTIDRGVLNALVENRQLIRADGGKVILTARAADAILAAQVNNSGIVQARTMAALTGGGYSKGTIELYSHGGRTNVSGTLDASAPDGGDGGFIETSGDEVKVADSTVITTKSADGANGMWLMWLIDPTDFTIGLGGAPLTASGIGVDTLLAQLATTAVTIQTSGSGAGNGDINVSAQLGTGSTLGINGLTDNLVTSNGLPNSLTLTAAGDIYVNAPIYWDANTLTLNAGKNVYLNADLVGLGTAGFAASYGSGSNANGTPFGLYAVMTGNSNSSFAGYGVNLSGSGGVKLNGVAYTVILDAAGLAAVNNDLSGNYVLGKSIVVASGQVAIGSADNPFTGVLNGLGASIGGTLIGTGVFDTIGATGVVSNLSVTASVDQPASGTITTGAVGVLANVNRGKIFNSMVNKSSDTQLGSINYTTAILGPGIADFYAGSIAGINSGQIIQGFAFFNTVGVTDIAGGLVGLNEAGGLIRDSAAHNTLVSDPTVPTVSYVGGLVGVNAGRIETSYSMRTSATSVADGNAGAKIGGVVGWNKAGGVIDQSFANAAALALAAPNSDQAAGFVWTNDGTITNSYSVQLNSFDGNQSNYFANRWAAGFVHDNSGTIDGAYTMVHSGKGSTDGTTLCGFACTNTGTIKNAYWSATVDPATTTAGVTTTPVTPTDTTTAKQLTPAAAATFASYAGFNPAAWAASLSGYPVLVNIPIYVSGSVSTTAPYYGQVTSDAASLVGTGAVQARGVQGGGGNNSLVDFVGQGLYDTQSNTVRNSFTVVTGDSDYLDAGAWSASLVLKSSVYKNIKGKLVVQPLPLQISPSLIADKTYDGSNSVVINPDAANDGLVGLVDDQTLTVDWSKLTGVVFDNANAGQNKTVTLVYGKVSDILKDGANGGKAGNYTFVGSTTAATKGNSVFRTQGGACSSSLCYWNVATQTYDLSTNPNTRVSTWYWDTSTKKFDIPDAQLVSGVTTYYNPVTGNYYERRANRVSLAAGACGSSGSSCFWNPTTQAYDLTVQVSGTFATSTFWYWNASSSKYDLLSPQTADFQASTTGNILPKVLTANLTASSKFYDGMTATTFSGGALVGVVGSDVVSLFTGNASAAFADANAGTDKTVTVSGLSLTGAAAGNYVIGPHTTTATINPLVLQLGGVKTIDGSASVAGANVVATNLVWGEQLEFTGTATLASGAAGVQAITDLGSLAINDPNYTLAGAGGTVTVSNGNMVVGTIYDNAASVLTAGKITTVTQTADKAIIDWLRFSVAADETVNFDQPSANAVILNRVIGNEQSVIAGAINANGKVFIVNSAGVLFTGSSRVNVGALVAGTLGMSVDSFKKGSYVLTAGNGGGSVSAAGSIVVADGGFITLASENGTTNTGNLTAQGGKVILASAKKLTLDYDTAGYEIENLSGTTVVGGVVNAANGLLETAGAAVSVAGNFGLGAATWSYTLPSITIGGTGSNVAASFVNSNLALRNVFLNALDGALTVNDAVSWSANTTLGLAAKSNVNINNAVSASGDSAGLTLAYGGDYLIRTKASYAGAVLDANGKPVAQIDPHDPANGGDGIYGSITFTNSANLHGLTINGHNYTLIHSMEDFDVLDGRNAATGTGTATSVSGDYALASDLDASGKTYVTGLVEAFGGTLAGLGHTINHFTINSPTEPVKGIGLIGMTVAGTTIRDLGLTNASIQTVLAPGAGSAALVGTANGTAFRGDWVTGSLTFTTSGVAGAIAGLGTNSTFTDTFADITGATFIGGGNSGGLVGSLSGGAITNSHVTGSLGNAAGGIIGYGNSVNITNSYYIGPSAQQGLKVVSDGNGGFLNVDIVSSGQAGGLAGRLRIAPGFGGVFNSFAIANLATNDKVPVIGGLVGEGSGVSVDNSWWKGDIYAPNVYTKIDETGGIAIGGLLGKNNNSSSTVATVISRSTASGSIRVSGTSARNGDDSVGGLVGIMTHANNGVADVIRDSEANVNIDAGIVGAVGGLIGTASAIDIVGSHATGNIIGGSFVGGLIGNNRPFQYTDKSLGRTVVPTTNIDGSYFNGNVSSVAPNGRVGALAGSGNQVKFNNSYWSNNITAPPVGQGLNSQGQWTGGNQGLSQESFANGDVQHYLDGTIGQVRADRAAAATAAATAAANLAAATRATSVTATTGVEKTFKHAAMPADAKAGTAQTRAKAGPKLEDKVDLKAAPAAVTQLDDERRRRKKSAPADAGADYGASIKSIDVDGQHFDLEKDDKEPAPGGIAPAPAGQQ